MLPIELREITQANREPVIAIHAGPVEGRFARMIVERETPASTR